MAEAAPNGVTTQGSKVAPSAMIGGVFRPLGVLAGDDGSVRVGLGGASGDGGGSGVGHREVDVERDASLGELIVDVCAVLAGAVAAFLFAPDAALGHVVPDGGVAAVVR